MRRVVIQGSDVHEDGVNSLHPHVRCWCKDGFCNTDCAAFTKMVVVKPDRTQDLVAVCAAIPQQIPIGVLEEGKVAIAAPTGLGPSLVRG